MNRGEPILQVHGLKKYFKNRYGLIRAVDGVHLKLYAGEIIGLIGESGSGKTTVGRCIIHLYENFSGTIDVMDRTIPSNKLSRNSSQYLREHVQMIFQDPHTSLNPQKTIYSILREPLIVNGLLKRRCQEWMSQWPDVIRNFNVTLKLRYYKVVTELLDNYLHTLERIYQQLDDYAANLHSESAEDFFLPLALSNSLNPLDIFSSLYTLLNNCHLELTQSVRHAYSSYEQLISHYKEVYQRQRDGDLETPERDYMIAQEEYRNYRRSVFYTPEELQQLNELTRLQRELTAHRQHVRESITSATSMLTLLLEERQSEMWVAQSRSLQAGNFAEYCMQLKHYAINQHIRKQLQSREHRILRYLSVTKIRELWEALEGVHQRLLERDWGIDLSDIRVAEQNINNYVATTLRFDYTPYKLLAHQTAAEYKRIDEELTAQIRALRKMHAPHKLCLRHLRLLKKPVRVSLSQRRAHLRQRHRELNTFINNYHTKIADELRQHSRQYQDRLRSYYRSYKELRQRLQKFAAVIVPPFKQFLIQRCATADLTRAQIDHHVRVFTNNLNENIAKFTNISQEHQRSMKEIRAVRWLYGFYANPKHLWLSGIVERRILTRILLNEAIYNILEDVGMLKQFAYRYPHEFSGGQRQRIAIARALISEPKILIADEPISSLDISIQAQIVNLLRDLCKSREIGIVFIAHDLSVVEYIADRILIMHRGRIVEHGNTGTIFANPLHPYTRNLFECVPSIQNAAIPFQSRLFDDDYINQQTTSRVVTRQVENGHWLTGTEAQIQEWTHKLSRS